MELQVLAIISQMTRLFIFIYIYQINLEFNQTRWQHDNDMII